MDNLDVQKGFWVIIFKISTTKAILKTMTISQTNPTIVRGGSKSAPYYPRDIDTGLATLRDKVDLVGLFLIQKCASVGVGSAGAATHSERLSLQAMGGFGKLLGSS